MAYQPHLTGGGALTDPLTIPSNQEFPFGSELDTRNWTANLAIYCPFHVDTDVTAKRIILWSNSSGGNVRVGLYDTAGNRLVTSSFTLAVNENIVNIADTALTAGNYYMAMSIDSLKSIFHWADSLSRLIRGPVAGVKSQFSGHPLPDPATFSNTEAHFPVMTVSMAA